MKIVTFNQRVLHAVPEFRFWHIGRQKMYLVDHFNRDGGVMWWPGEDADNEVWRLACSDTFELTDGVLMQFPGLLDCTGAKVWEGDIVYGTFLQKDVEGGLLHSYCHVVFARGGLDLVAGLDGTDVEPFNADCGIDEVPDEAPISNRVVGNIHQRLDLLKRDYYNVDDGSSTGIPPDTPDYEPESIYTYAPEPSIGIIDEQSHLSPSDKHLICSNQTPSLLSE